MLNRPVPTIDRRRYPRFETLYLFLFEDACGGFCSGRTLDVSQGGVQVETYEAMLPGGRKTFEVVTDSQSYSAAGTVIHSRQARQGIYLSGIEFDRRNADIARSFSDPAHIPPAVLSTGKGPFFPTLPGGRVPDKKSQRKPD